MASARSRWAWSLPLLLGIALTLAPGVAACTAVPGQLFVPTLTSGYPHFPSCALKEVQVCVPATPGAPYTLAADAPVSSLCVNTQCIKTPDFNVAWYASSSPFDTPIANHNTLGNQAGTVPQGATFGIVYMRYGPDLLGDDKLGASFLFRVAC